MTHRDYYRVWSGKEQNRYKTQVLLIIGTPKEGISDKRLEWRTGKIEIPGM